MGFKENLKMLRKAKGMTQEEFGKLINKTLLTVSRYENGTIFPTLNTLREICGVFDIEIINLLMDVEYENKKYNLDEIKTLLKHKRNRAVHSVNHELTHIILSGKNSNEILKETEKKIAPNELESSILDFSLLLDNDLLKNIQNISDNDKIKILEDLKKYYLFLISYYSKKNND